MLLCNPQVCSNAVFREKQLPSWCPAIDTAHFVFTVVLGTLALASPSDSFKSLGFICGCSSAHLQIVF